MEGDSLDLRFPRHINFIYIFNYFTKYIVERKRVNNIK